MPAAARSFDFNTISDVILHIRYTAREGGDGLKARAAEQFLAPVPPARPAPPAGGYPQVLLSCRNEFANDWMAAKARNATLTIQLGVHLLPYWMQAMDFKIVGIATVSWPATEPLTPTVIWPVPTGGVAQPGLGSAGLGGVAEVGSVANQDDLFVLLRVGRIAD